jgi:hypothetical protein
MRATAAATEADRAQRALLAADIKRFLERPSADAAKLIPPSPAPPGAPIGDMPQDWLQTPAKCQADPDTGACRVFAPGW